MKIISNFIRLLLNLSRKFIKAFLISSLNIFRSKPFSVQIFPNEIKKKYNIKINNIEILFSPTNDHAYRRWKAFERTGKEKNTIDWIDTFKNNSIFYDIGANVGVFSVYAAIQKKAKVFAFEPEPNSFIELFNCIQLNNVDVTAMLLPLESKSNTNFFNLTDEFEAGGSGHIFGNKLPSKLHYGICSDTIDNLVKFKTIPIPDYIKIDVDGLEKKILTGMENLWTNNKLKSILIEFMNKEELNSYTLYLKKFGFSVIQGPTGLNKNYIFSRTTNEKNF